MPPSVDAHVATMYMRVPVGTPPMCVNIDSTFIPPTGYFVFNSEAGGTIVPDYIDCGLGDIWIGGGTLRGDVDRMGNFNLSDAVYLVRYIFDRGTSASADFCGRCQLRYPP